MDTKFDVDHIEFDVTTQISALQHVVCVRACVHACAVEIKLVDVLA